MEVVGILKEKLADNIGVSKVGNPYHFATYLFVIPGMYEKKIAFEVSDGMSKRIALFDEHLGKEVRVFFDIDARQMDGGRWYNRVQAYGVRSEARNTSEPTPPASTPETPQKTQEIPF